MAIVEADELLNEALGKLGFVGKDTNEKMETVKPGQLTGIEELRSARILYRRITEDPGYEVNLEEIKSVLDLYERFFRGVEMID